MTPVQQSAFDAGAGVIGAHSGLPRLIAGVIVVAAMLWLTWVALGHFRAWSKGHGAQNGSLGDLALPPAAYRSARKTDDRGQRLEDSD